MVGYLVLGLLTVTALGSWCVIARHRRRDRRASRRWAWFATVLAVDGWAWWLVSGSPWRTAVHVLLFPLLAFNFLLAWFVVSDLTGVTLLGSRSARIEGAVKGLDDDPRR